MLAFHGGVEDRCENALEVDAAEPLVEASSTPSDALSVDAAARGRGFGSVAFLSESGAGGAHLARGTNRPRRWRRSMAQRS